MGNIDADHWTNKVDVSVDIELMTTDDNVTPPLFKCPLAVYEAYLRLYMALARVGVLVPKALYLELVLAAESRRSRGRSKGSESSWRGRQRGEKIRKCSMELYYKVTFQDNRLLFLGLRSRDALFRPRVLKMLERMLRNADALAC